MNTFKAVCLVAVVGLLATTAYQQHQILSNQRAQMKQQFHSDLISLVSLLGENGLRKLNSTDNPKDLSEKESFATGILLQRIIVAYWIRDAFTPSEFEEMVVKDGKATLSSPLLRARWQTAKKWYSKDIQDFMDNVLIADEKK